MKKTKKKRLVRGKDWHAWVWKAGSTWPNPGELFHFACPTKRNSPPKMMGAWTAGAMIYRESTGRVPDFYAATDATLADIRACAARGNG